MLRRIFSDSNDTYTRYRKSTKRRFRCSSATQTRRQWPYSSILHKVRKHSPRCPRRSNAHFLVARTLSAAFWNPCPGLDYHWTKYVSNWTLTWMKGWVQTSSESPFSLASSSLVSWVSAPRFMVETLQEIFNIYCWASISKPHQTANKVEINKLLQEYLLEYTATGDLELYCTNQYYNTEDPDKSLAVYARTLAFGGRTCLTTWKTRRTPWWKAHTIDTKATD